MMCDCQSGNAPHIGAVPAAVLTIPEGLAFAGKSVCVDQCIRAAVERLWAAGVSTLSNCCGHNGRFPRHVLVDQHEADAARAAVVDDTIAIMFWRDERLVTHERP